jgi:hypothetical protein
MTQTPDPRRRMRIAGGLMIFAGLLMIVGVVGGMISGEPRHGVGEIVLVACGAAVVWCGFMLRRLQPTVVGTKPPDDPGAGGG